MFSSNRRVFVQQRTAQPYSTDPQTLHRRRKRDPAPQQKDVGPSNPSQPNPDHTLGTEAAHRSTMRWSSRPPALNALSAPARPL